MTVYVNGEERSVGDGATVADIVASLGRARGARGVAVAVNGVVVVRSEWSGTKLTENDRVEVLEAIGGG
jgi:thiamine biosynthesis protein ThiS